MIFPLFRELQKNLKRLGILAFKFFESNGKNKELKGNFLNKCLFARLFIARCFARDHIVEVANRELYCL